MIDFHSHILPQMDDGSKSVEESLAMLNELSRQGIKTVVATPHFYANDETVQSFIERRLNSYKSIEASLTPDMPRVLLGAEVKYYEGISRMENLRELCVGDTELLLLEMPMRRWTEYVLRELVDISCSGNVTLVLAHIERYIKLQSDKAIGQLLSNGILLQINASFVCDFFTKRQAMNLLKNRAVHLIGSDCHNMSDRAPDIGRAYEKISKKLGNEFITEFDNYAKNFIK